MNKKAYTLAAAIMASFLIGFNAYAKVNSTNDDGDYLKIFTPQHNIKQVFNESQTNPVFQRQLTQNEIELLAKVVYAESKGEPYTGKIGVASVILNRLSHPQFPKSIEGVIFEKNAFSCIDDRYADIRPDVETYKAVDDALNGSDPTGEAIFFYNPDTATSSWMKNVSKDNITIIGNHVFFK